MSEQQEAIAEDADVPMTIEERLLYLEEQNEGLKRVGKMLLALCLLTAGLLVWTQVGQRSSLYSEAMIFGTGDTPRGTLTTTPNNHLAFLFYDQFGILPPSPKFGSIPHLDGFAIYDRQGNPRIVVGVTDQNQAVLDVLDAQGNVVTRSGETPTAPSEASDGAAAAPSTAGTAAAAGTAPAAPQAPVPTAPAAP